MQHEEHMDHPHSLIQIYEAVLAGHARLIEANRPYIPPRAQTPPNAAVSISFRSPRHARRARSFIHSVHS